YDYTKALFSESEHQLMKTYFVDAATYFENNVNVVFSRVYSDRENGAIKLSGMDTLRDYTHHGGYQIPTLAYFYNNRRASMFRVYGMVGVYYDISSLKKSARLFYQEFFKYGVFPDGTSSEFYRNTNDHPEVG